MVSFAESKDKHSVIIILHRHDVEHPGQGEKIDQHQHFVNMEKRRSVAEQRRIMGMDRDKKKRAVSIFTGTQGPGARTGAHCTRYCLVCEGVLCWLFLNDLNLHYDWATLGFLCRGPSRKPSRIATPSLVSPHSHLARIIIIVLYSTIIQDLEKYVREGRKENALRVMRWIRQAMAVEGARGGDTVVVYFVGRYVM